MLKLSSRFGLLITAFLVSVMGVHAGTTGVGRDEIRDPPDAICQVHTPAGDACSGTLVRKGKSVAVVTAGHCLIDDQTSLVSDLTGIRIACGCRDGGCVEEFTLKKGTVPEVRSEGGTGDTVLKDSAFIELDHAPSRVTPLTFSHLKLFYDFQAGKFLPGASCIKGGFGHDTSGNYTDVPHLFPASFSRLMTTLADSFVIEVLGTVRESEWGERKSAGTSAEDFIQGLVRDHRISNSLMPGDSGSGLLCRMHGGHYRVVGVLESISLQRSDERPGYREVVNQFSLIPKSFRELR